VRAGRQVAVLTPSDVLGAAEEFGPVPGVGVVGEALHEHESIVNVLDARQGYVVAKPRTIELLEVADEDVTMLGV